MPHHIRATLLAAAAALVTATCRAAPAPAPRTGGGEYPTQDGFGWTNGVTLRLLARQEAPLRPTAGAGSAAR